MSGLAGDLQLSRAQPAGHLASCRRGTGLASLQPCHAKCRQTGRQASSCRLCLALNYSREAAQSHNARCEQAPALQPRHEREHAACAEGRAFQAWKWREVSFPKLGSDMCTLKLWLWSMKAPLSAAMSTTTRCLISHTVLYNLFRSPGMSSSCARTERSVSGQAQADTRRGWLGAAGHHALPTSSCTTFQVVQGFQHLHTGSDRLVTPLGKGT